MSLAKERLIVGVVLIVIGLLSAALVIASGSARLHAHLNQVTPVTQQGLPTRLPTGRVQVVRFTLYDAGIYPSEARAQTGLVAFSVEDLSGTSSGLVVERREHGVTEPIGRVDRRPGRLRARGRRSIVGGRNLAGLWPRR